MMMGVPVDFLNALHVLLNFRISLLRCRKIPRLERLPESIEVLRDRLESRDLWIHAGRLNTAAGFRRNLDQLGEILLGRFQISGLKVLPKLLELRTPALRGGVYATGLV